MVLDARLPRWIPIDVVVPLTPSRRLRPTSPSRPSCPRPRRPPPPSPRSSPIWSSQEPTATYEEPRLLQLIRQGDVASAGELCRRDPRQAEPVPRDFLVRLPSSPPAWPHTTDRRDSRGPGTRPRTRRGAGGSAVVPSGYHPTALGTWLRQALPEGTTRGAGVSMQEVLALARALLEACPYQVRCHMEELGGTPLRFVLAHASHTTDQQGLIDLVRLLLDTDAALPTAWSETGAVGQQGPAVYQPDAEGRQVVDHVLSSLQLGWMEAETAVALLQLLMDYAARKEHAAGGPVVTPSESDILIRLYSMGTSFGFMTPTDHPPSPMTSWLLPETADACRRMERILKCTQRLLHWRPSLLCAKSALTQCTPLHVALRNYGNFDPLIRELLLHPVGSHWMVHQRSIYGDLPLHVACAVGVPMDVLHLVLTRTLLASQQARHEQDTHPSGRDSGPHPLVWSQNAAGYTPVDLEWIRHIEAGNGFFSHRSFYPLDSRGVRKLPSGRSSELYKTLLRQAVDQIMAAQETQMEEAGPDKTSLDEARLARMTSLPECSGAFGLLLHRIFLIIRAAFHDSFSTFPADLSGDILHLAAALIRPTSPTLPRPIGDLIRWQYPEELKRRDHLGRLPLHYCCGAADGSLRRLPLTEHEGTASSDWYAWVEEIIRLEPLAARTKDNFGRLPLHYALERPCPPCSDVRLIQPILAALARTIDALMAVHPDSVECCDPVTGLYPFMLAATNDTLPLTCLFALLRHTPIVSRSCFHGGCEYRRMKRKRSLSSA